MTYKVALDLGHIASTPNGAADYNEHEGMVRIGNEMLRMLSLYPQLEVRIFDIPYHDNSKEEMLEVVRQVNEWGADIFLSLHSNAFSDDSVRGYEVFSYSLDKSTSGWKLAESVRLNTMNILPVLKDYDRGVKAGDEYYVIRETSMPAIIIEHEFHTNDEGRQLLQENYVDFAKANVFGILDFYGIKEQEMSREAKDIQINFLGTMVDGVLVGDDSYAKLRPLEEILTNTIRQEVIQAVQTVMDNREFVVNWNPEDGASIVYK